MATKPENIARIRKIRADATAAGTKPFAIGPGGGGTVHELPIVLDPRNPWDIAKTYLLNECRHSESSTLCFWRDQWWTWLAEGGWRPCSEQAIRDQLYPWLASTKQRDKGDGLVPLKANARLVTSVSDGLRSAAPLPAEVEPPTWLPARPEQHDASDVDLPPARSFIPVANGRLNIQNGVLEPPTPRFFATHTTPIPWIEDAPIPARWLQLLNEEIWPEDKQAVRCFRQWCGYLVSGRTDLHSVLFVVGPARSGKGTLGAVMSALVGERNVTRPMIGAFGRPFGLEPLIGKTLALVPDARLGNRADQAEIVERILSVSGGDNPAIERKFLPAYTGSLSARLVIMSNELPAVSDTSGAFASRMLVLRMVRSFLGKEDAGLRDTLMAELPGILRWAIGGLNDLRQAGRFVAPDSAGDIMQVLREAGSDLQTFVDESCDLGATEENGDLKRCAPDAIHQAFVAWLHDNGVERRVSKLVLGRQLRAVCPGVRRVQTRNGSLREWTYEGISLNFHKPAPAQGSIPLS